MEAFIAHRKDNYSHGDDIENIHQLTIIVIVQIIYLLIEKIEIATI